MYLFTLFLYVCVCVAMMILCVLNCIGRNRVCSVIEIVRACFSWQDTWTGREIQEWGEVAARFCFPGTIEGSTVALGTFAHRAKTEVALLRVCDVKREQLGPPLLRRLGQG